MSRPRVLVVQKPSSFQRLIGGGSRKRVTRLLEEQDPAVARMKKSHEDHVATVGQAKQILSALGVDATYQSVTSDIDATGFDLVVTLGGDGTLLTASRGVGPKTPTLAVNTAPLTSIGYFCAAEPSDIEEVLRKAIGGDLKNTSLTRMEVEVDGRVISSRVLNDMLFSAASPAATTRYILYHRGENEDQKSSGVWVGPAAGSTAAQRSAGGKVLPIGSQRLQFVVREPYYGDREPYAFVRGLIEPGEELRLKSKTADARVWLDGPHLEYSAHLGSDVRLRRSSEPLRIMGLRRRRETRNPGARDEAL